MNNLPVVVTVAVSFIVTASLGYWLIPLMRRIKFGQTILDIGPRWHKSKQGTPTMGGIMFAVGVPVGALIGMGMLLGRIGGVGYLVQTRDILLIVLGLVMALGFGLIGFFDDYIKVVKKQNLGLSERQKLVMQLVLASAYILLLYISGGISTRVNIPFLFQVDLGLFYYPLAIGGIVYIINVVNFTDGIDGLCTSVTFASALGFLVIAGILHNEGMAVAAGALAGGSLGFLVWNLHPAKIFMGDTGSMFLGGMIVALAFGLGIPVFLIFLGVVYIIEGLSVLIQRFYFKYTRRKYGEGRRIFKMSPIHHHFEMSGWSENKIVLVFTVVQLLASAVSVYAVTIFYR